MKVALVYDRVNKWGGAERVLLALHELFPDAPLYTSVYNAQKAAWAKVFRIKTSFLQKLSATRSNHEYIPYLMPAAFEHFTFDEYDVVISLTSEAAKGIITKPHTKHICYCLTPTRYLWSGYREYLNNSLKRFIARPFVSYLRKWDVAASFRPDLFVAASHEVKNRIKKYYNKVAATVIYPPTNMLPNSERNTKKREGSYFLVVSRFVPYKRIDLAIAACNSLHLPLKIIGKGREERKLRAMAGNTVEFVGEVSDESLVEYYKNAKALLFPGTEDFGLTVVESQMYGRPVIAYRGGGALETIIEGKTGAFFNTQTASSLREALISFNWEIYSPRACMQQADKFSLPVFKNQFRRLVDSFIS